MRLKMLGTTIDLALKNNTYLLFSNVILAGLLAASVTANLSSHERVTLVPPQLDKQAEISWNSADANYMKAFGLYVASMVGNITPKNVKLTADAIGAHLDAEIYAPVRSQILSLANDETFQRSNAMNYFAPSSVTYEVDEQKRNKVFVVGTLTTVGFNQNDNTRPDGNPVVYEIGVKIQAGRPIITSFTSYQGKQPHTAKWVAAQGKRTEQDADQGNID